MINKIWKDEKIWKESGEEGGAGVKKMGFVGKKFSEEREQHPTSIFTITFVT